MKPASPLTVAAPGPDTVAPEEIPAWASTRSPQHRARDAEARSAVTRGRDFAAAEREFMQAMQAYKQTSGRMFPTWSEVLEVLRSLGYQRQA
jgi:hypothetical protein